MVHELARAVAGKAARVGVAGEEVEAQFGGDGDGGGGGCEYEGEDWEDGEVELHFLGGRICVGCVGGFVVGNGWNLKDPTG